MFLLYNIFSQCHNAGMKNFSKKSSKKVAGKNNAPIAKSTMIFCKSFWSAKRVLIGVVCFALLSDMLSKQFIIYMAYGDFFRFAFAENFEYTGIMFGRVTSFFNLVLVYNKGVSFSMLASNATAMRWLLSALAMLIIIFILQTMQEEKKLAHKIALAFVVAGALGNILDRLRFGAVVDFLDFHLYGYHWPAFNFADICISCGVGLFVILKIVEYRKSLNTTK